MNSPAVRDESEPIRRLYSFEDLPFCLVWISRDGNLRREETLRFETLPTLLALIEAQQAMLSRVEFVAGVRYAEDGTLECLVCGGTDKSGHAEGCALAALRDDHQRVWGTLRRSGFLMMSNNLGSLRSLGLVAYPQPGFVAATSVLFLER